jgi:hypothetical protein
MACYETSRYASHPQNGGGMAGTLDTVTLSNHRPDVRHIG